ncbi:MAG TPA: response regulator, partial [Gemmata sp.]|nr:response regulator [Gemmata sp.]
MTNSSSVAPSVPNGPPQRVLIVEDLEDTRESLKELLQVSLGLEVDTAEDGAKGLALLREHAYSLVITDLRMPKLSGMKLIETVQTEKIPVTVIVTTGHGSIKDAVEAMRMGAFDFLTKPPDPQHLCLLVKRA